MAHEQVSYTKYQIESEKQTGVRNEDVQAWCHVFYTPVIHSIIQIQVIFLPFCLQVEVHVCEAIADDRG